MGCSAGVVELMRERGTLLAAGPGDLVAMKLHGDADGDGYVTYILPSGTVQIYRL